MRETAHSRLLWQILKLEKILESFANKFFRDISFTNEKYWLNLPDKFRIDISFYTETDFFIFENKINDAQEQCGQIYRYVNHALKLGFTHYPLEDYEWVRDNDHDIHIDFEYQGYSLSACLTIKNSLFWGRVCKNRAIPKKWNSAIHSSIQLFLPRAQSTDWWPAWNYTSYENGLERFLTLMNWVIENEGQ